MKGAVLALGIIGALFGFIGAIFAMGIGGIGAGFEADGASSIIKSGGVAALASLVGLIGAVLVFSKPKLGGWLMIGAASVGFVMIFMAYMIGGAFLLIAGILSLKYKQKNHNPEK